MAITWTAGIFIALFLESVLYGIALTLGIATVLVLSRADSERRLTHRYLIFVLCLMLMVATPHIVISFIRKYRTFVTPSKEEGWGDSIFDPLLNAQNILLVMQTILGDGVNVWRLYVVYGRKVKYIIVPSVMMLAGAVSGCLGTSTFATQRVLDAVFGPWGKVCEALMITTNVYCTVAVSWKIYRTTHSHPSSSSARSALVIIAETGVLYTSSLAFCLGCAVARSPVLLIAMDIIPPLVPSIFCFMILQTRTSRNSILPAVHTIRNVLPQPSADGPWAQIWRVLGHDRGASISSSRPVQIQISREEEEHSSVLHVRKHADDIASVRDSDEVSCKA